MALNATERTNIVKLTVALYNAAPGASGLSDFTTFYEANGRDLNVLATNLTSNILFKSLYPNFLTVGDFATAILSNYGLQANTDAIAFITSRFNAGMNKGQIAYEAAIAINNTSAATGDFANARAILNNKTLVAENYSVALSGQSVNIGVLQGVIAGVTADPATVTAANNTNANALGQTFTLTAAVDNIVGTSGNDTIIADNTGTTKQLTVADQINGGAGTDTLKIYLAAGDTVTGQPSLVSIENVYINGGLISAYTAATGTIALSIDSGIVVDAAAGGNAAAGAVSYTLAGQSLTLANSVKSNNAAAVTAGTNTTTVASATDTVENITVNNYKTVAAGTTGGITATQTLDLNGGKVVTLNVTATGATSAFLLTNTGTALTTMNVAGDKNVTITETLAGLKTISASAATGNVTVDKTGVAATAGFTFTGGAGNDTLKLRAGDLGLLTSGAQLDGGPGTGDKLAILDTALVASDYAKLNATKGFEVLSLNAAITVDASQLTSFNQFAVDTGALTQTISNLATGNITTLTAAPTSLTLGVAVGVTAETINIGIATSTGLTATTLVTTGATSIALSSNGTNATANVITTLTNSDNTLLTITGSNDLTITNALSGTATGSKVDASAFTGKLTVTGSGQGDILIGGSGADTLISGAKSTTLTGGAGADNFNVAAAVYGAGAQTDTIIDFAKGTDKITIATQGTAVFAPVAINVTAATTFIGALNIAVNALAAGNTNAQVDYFQFGGNTYIVESVTAAHTTVAATDLVIKLTGAIDLSTLTITGTSVLS